MLSVLVVMLLDSHFLLPFPVIYPGVTLCCTVLLCYACRVPRRSVAHISSAADSLCTTTLLIVHAASGHEGECDESFRARHHTLLLLCGEVLSAPPHDVRLSAKVRREYRSSGVLALVVGA
jgi:hypothetical protein